MANVKVEIDVAFNNISKKIQKYNRKVISSTADIVQDGIMESIEKGISPVSGKGPYEKYSTSYQKAIRRGTGILGRSGKKIRPINLKVTGGMLKSWRKNLRSNGFTLWLTSGIAKYHDSMGAGKSKTIRQIFPKSGESFNRNITKKISLNLKRLRFTIFK